MDGHRGSSIVGHARDGGCKYALNGLREKQI